VANGQRAVRGEGGRYLFRGHREYRPGDDLRRVDWNVAARHDRLQVRQYDAQKDALSEVWLDGSASMAPFGGRAAAARAAALCCATGLGSGGRVKLGILRGGTPVRLAEAAEPGHMRRIFEALSRDLPAERADLAGALPRLHKQLARGARFLLISDLLTRADPGVLYGLAGRRVRGALLHLRTPAINAPSPGSVFRARDVETGLQRTVRLDSRAAVRIAARAKDHADLWAHHARMVGMLYMPFAPEFAPETLLRRLILEVP
jgi:uncharacterized protein (DUF58 family)